MCTISRLPFELLALVADLTVVRHPTEGHVVDFSSLAAFSSTSSTLRAISLPVLFREVSITSEEQLAALSQADPQYLRCTRELNVFYSIQLFESFRFWGFIRNGMGPNTYLSPFDALARILSRTPHLSTLRIQVARLSGPQSPWSPLFIKEPFAVPMSEALARLSITNSLRLEKLANLELDGFSNIDALLQAAPNLRTLRLRLSGGLAQHVNLELVRALKHASGLRELVYTPATLRLKKEAAVPLQVANGLFWNFAHEDEDEDEDQVNVSPTEEMHARVEFISALGAVVPCLEVLDLRTRWFGLEQPSFCAPEELVPPTALIEALSPFRKLKRLSLPTTVLPPSSSIELNNDTDVLRTLYAQQISVPHNLLLAERDQAAELELVSRRQEIFDRVVQAEKDAVDSLLFMRDRDDNTRSQSQSQSRVEGESGPQLESLSFVRPVDTSESVSRTVTYTSVRGLCPPACESIAPLVLPALGRVTVQSHCASAGQFDPIPPPLPSHYSYRARFVVSLSLRHLRDFYARIHPKGTITIPSFPSHPRQQWHSRIEDHPLDFDFDSPMVSVSIALASFGGVLLHDALRGGLLYMSKNSGSVLDAMGVPIVGGLVNEGMAALAAVL